MMRPFAKRWNDDASRLRGGDLSAEPDLQPSAPPRRGPRYTSHDNSTLIKRRLA